MIEQLNIDLQQTIVRFSDKFTIGDECWEWSTPGDSKHYPKFSLGTGKKVDSHRVSYQLFNGTNIPKGMMICHKCDNRRCVRPDHLFLGTRSDNMKDCWNKSRMTMPRPPQTRLNEEKVSVIRAELRNGKTQASLARQFGVDKSTIKDIADRTTWKNVA